MRGILTVCLGSVKKNAVLKGHIQSFGSWRIALWTALPDEADIIFLIASLRFDIGSISRLNGEQASAANRSAAKSAGALEILFCAVFSLDNFLAPRPDATHPIKLCLRTL
jgi:hypothetical protein